LYDTCQHVLDAIDSEGLDRFKTRGAIALETGFLISMVGPDDPDDPDKVQAVRDAAKRLFDIDVPA
jgi:hypothetical protein